VSVDPEAPAVPDVDPTMVEHVLGDSLATMTVLEYGDYECPYCAAAAPVLRQMVDQSEGRVRMVYRNFPLFEVHPHALTAALAAESTTASGKFWNMHYLLFEQQARLSDFDLRKYALHVGADPDLAAGEPAQRFAGKVQADYAAGLAAGVAGTPTLFINGEPYLGRVELGALQRATGTLRGRR
jgi:protein-disulfide isomerase